MFLGGVGRAEAEFARDVGAGGGVTGQVLVAADEVEDLLLSDGEFLHGARPGVKVL